MERSVESLQAQCNNLVWLGKIINKRTNSCCQRCFLLIGLNSLSAAEMSLKRETKVRRLCTEGPVESLIQIQVQK